MGMKSLRPSLATSAQRGAWIRLLTSSLEQAAGRNRKAIAALVEGEDGALVRSRLRVLAPTENLPALIHAKIILIDHCRGYLGSANLSQSAMDYNLEVGLSLAPAQVSALESLIKLLEAQNFVVDRTAVVLAA
jgi:phosphatidylserine/phosphatidylglycerophosphate/cardiolipin synthase-like enzyme